MCAERTLFRRFEHDPVADGIGVGQVFFDGIVIEAQPQLLVQFVLGDGHAPGLGRGAVPQPRFRPFQKGRRRAADLVRRGGKAVVDLRRQDSRVLRQGQQRRH